jgi:2-C-methyl-D-erythritol 4-phosphate cytidylyltransferase
VAGMPVKDTIKLADTAGYAASTPDRSLVWQVQTPQVFDTALITDAYGRLRHSEAELQAQGIKITDDAMVVETLLHHPVKLVQGSYQNIKITTPEDLAVAEAFLTCR